MLHEISEKRWKGRVQRKLLRWFEENGRSFPWRRTTNPFLVLIAEKLLQQTAATPAVIAAYRQTVRLFPTPAALALAPVRTLKTIIAPLGFHYRAVELKLLAKTIVSKHNGRVPEDFSALMQLPGVGDYSARAVLAFAFGLDLPVVDLMLRVSFIEFTACMLPSETIPLVVAGSFSWQRRSCRMVAPETSTSRFSISAL